MRDQRRLRQHRYSLLAGDGGVPCGLHLIAAYVALDGGPWFQLMRVPVGSAVARRGEMGSPQWFTTDGEWLEVYPQPNAPAALLVTGYYAPAFDPAWLAAYRAELATYGEGIA